MKTIFVSSTFKDMHYERDLIHEQVLPQLNDYAAEYGDSVSFCDLRWGVNTGDLDNEEGSKKVLSVCLDEIDRCRPYMIVILGERYGWIPEEKLISETIQSKKNFSLDELEKSVTALEIEYGALSSPEQLEKTLFYYRESEGTMPDIYLKEDSVHAEKLRELKERIWKLTGGKVKSYKIRWDEKQDRPVGQEQFAEFVTEDIKKMLEKDWQAYGELSEFEKDQLAQWDLVQQKAGQFAAREAFVDQCIRELKEGRKMLVIQGGAGSGKSTLMSRLAVRFRDEKKTVLPVFCGYTGMTGSGMALIRYLIYFLEEQLEWEHFFMQDDDSQQNWLERLAELTAAYSRSGSSELIVLLDAIDQLPEDEIRDELLFIPGNLCENFKIIISCLDTTPLPRVEKEAIHQTGILEEKEKAEMLAGMVRYAGRELSDAVIWHILQKKDSASPLYLNLIISRLLMMNKEDFDQITARGDGIEAITEHQIRIIDAMPEALEEICVELLGTASERIGGDLVKMAASYIAVSRHGLREQELSTLARMTGVTWNNLDFSRFVKYMRSFFMIREDGRYDFSHKSLREGFRRQCTDLKEMHNRILRCLIQLPMEDPVRIGEWMYHCIRADDKAYAVSCIQHSDVESPLREAAARDLKEESMKDGGKWLTELLKNGKTYGVKAEFSYFINREYRLAFSDSLEELKTRERVQTENKNYMEQYAARFPEPDNKRELSICYEKNANICMLYKDRENLFRAKMLYENAFSISKELLEMEETNKHRQDLSIDYGNLADIYEELQGEEDLQKALEFRKKAVCLRKKIVQTDPSVKNQTGLTTALNALGCTFETLDGEFYLKKALSCYQQAYELQKKLDEAEPSPESKRRLSNCMLNLADVYSLKKTREDQEKAVLLCQEVCRIRENLAEIKGTTNALRSLAYAYVHLGTLYIENKSQKELDLAVKLYEKAYTIRKTLEEELKTSNSRNQLSSICFSLRKAYSLYRDTEHYKKALEYARMDLKLSEQLNDELRTAASEKSLAQSYLAMGRLQRKIGGERIIREAVSNALLAEKIFRKQAGELKTAESRQNLSECYNFLSGCFDDLGSKEDIRQAIIWGEKDLEISISLEKELHTLNSLEDLGFSYHKLSNSYYQCAENEEDLKKSLDLCRKAYDIFEKLHQIRKTADSLENVGLCAQYLAGRTFLQYGLVEVQETIRMQEKSLEIDRTLVKDLGTLECRQELLRNCIRTGDLYRCFSGGGPDWEGKALDLFQEAVQIAKENCADGTYIDYEDFVTALSRLAEHPYVTVESKKIQLNFMLTITKKMAEERPEKKYDEWLEIFKTALEKLNTDQE